MALIKVLSFAAGEYSPLEQDATDEVAFGKVTLSGLSGVGIDMGSSSIINLATPANGNDAANKSYVDSVAAGLSAKGTCRFLADSNIAALTGLTATPDGGTLVDGDRVLLTAQTTDSQNGIWVAHSGAWTRPADFAAGAHASGAYAFIREGTTYADQGWVCTTDTTDVVGTDSLTFMEFTGLGEVTAGAGLTKSGNTMDIGKGNGIAVAADSISIDLDTTPALALNGTSPNKKLAFLPDTTRGLDKDASGAFISLATTPALQFTSGKLDTKLDTTRGLAKDASGAYVALATNPGLQFSAGLLNAKNDTTRGVGKDASGLFVHIDPTADGSLKFDGTTGALEAHLDPAGAIGTSANGLTVLVDGVRSSIDTGNDQLTVLSAPQADKLVASSNTPAGGTAGAAVIVASDGSYAVGTASGTDVQAHVIGVFDGTQVINHGPAGGVLSGATPGTVYFMGASGGPVLAAGLPVGSAHVVRLGFALSATDLFVQLQDMGRKAA